MIGVGDLRWAESVLSTEVAEVPGTDMSIIRFRKTPGGPFTVVESGEYRERLMLGDVVDLQCWLCAITSEGKS